MKFAASFLLLISAVAGRVFEPKGDVPLDSALGKRLLEKATVVEASRYLNNNNENSFLSAYAIKYLGCAGLVQVNAEGQGGNNGENNILFMNNLVRFALCPADACSACTGGGEYVVNMYDFVDAYTEYKLTEQELTCENLRESCYCENANDEDNCESQCYTDAGHEECIQYEGQEDFEVQRYLQCGEFKANNNNNNNNGNANAYYIGAYCSPKDGKSIHMGIFTDMGCVTHGDSAVFSASYGTDLPYASTSMVGSDCIACQTVEENDNGEQNYQLNEICQNTYENAAKCETNMDSYYKDTSACDYIQNILPRLEAASRSVSGGGSSKSSSKSSKAATAFAWIFAATTIMFGAYAYFLYRKIKRGSVNLSAQDGAIA